jgi:hypothetical protein
LRKGCVKNCVKKQSVENQALAEILSAFPHMRKDHPKPATHRLTSQSIGTIFAVKALIFSIHFCICVLCVIKCVKSLKIKGLGFWGSLWACFGLVLGFVELLLKTCYNKAPPKPRPLLSTTAQHQVRLLGT